MSHEKHPQSLHIPGAEDFDTVKLPTQPDSTVFHTGDVRKAYIEFGQSVEATIEKAKRIQEDREEDHRRLQANMAQVMKLPSAATKPPTARHI